MKIIILVALLIAVALVDAVPAESNQNQVQPTKAKELIDILTFDTEAIINDVTRDKRQFGKK